MLQSSAESAMAGWILQRVLGQASGFTLGNVPINSVLKVEMLTDYAFTKGIAVCPNEAFGL